MAQQQTIHLSAPPSVLAYANIGGKYEADGPLSSYFDRLEQDSFFGEKTYEQAESAMQKYVLSKALQKAGLQEGDLDCIFGGDLLNQCIGTGFAMRAFSAPFYGLYGACSTMGESLALAALMVNAGYMNYTAAVTSSHFCSAERQYRMPLPYGSQRCPTAQWTATASGCTILSKNGDGPYITHVTRGRVIDKGITDANNMGAAMAPAALDTLLAFFHDTGYDPGDFDRIITGDLGKLGSQILVELAHREGLELSANHSDCGLLLYDLERQDMHCGASGCGCSAAVLNGYLYAMLKKKQWNRILFAPTGALLSPTSSFQGESIPSICHAVCISNEKE